MIPRAHGLQGFQLAAAVDENLQPRIPGPPKNRSSALRFVREPEVVGSGVLICLFYGEHLCFWFYAEWEREF